MSENNLIPIHRLPVELLREIFLHAGDEADDDLRRLRCNTPWIIALVCRRWRDVLATTRSRKVVHTEKADITITPDGHSLSVTFRVIDTVNLAPPKEEPWRNFDKVLPFALADAEKWIRLNVIAEPAFIASLSQLTGRLSTLQSLDLRSAEVVTGSEGELFIGVSPFGQLPQLTSLVGNPSLLRSLYLPLNQLRHLDLLPCHPCHSINGIFEILQLTPLLESCSVDYSYSSQPTSIPHFQALTLPCITSFTISIYGYTVMKFLTLPALETCHFNTKTNNDPLHDDVNNAVNPLVVLEFLSRSSTASGGLKHLRISVDDAFEEVMCDWVTLISPLPTILCLEIQKTGFTLGEDFEDLFMHFIDTSSADFLPALQTIAMNVEYRFPEASDHYALWAGRLLQTRPGLHISVREIKYP